MTLDDEELAASMGCAPWFALLVFVVAWILVAHHHGTAALLFGWIPAGVIAWIAASVVAATGRAGVGCAALLTASGMVLVLLRACASTN